MSWKNLPEAPAPQTARLMRELGVSPIVARLLARLGFDDPALAKNFLRSDIRQVDDPSRITHLDEAVARISQAIDRKEKIVIFGDYDVDGVTAVAVLVLALRQLGAAPRYAGPRRLSEGYGLSQAALDRVLSEGRPDLFITLDCGTNSVEPIAYLRAKGVDVIIADHHRAKGCGEADATIVNPHVYDQPDEPWTHLCAVGLAFKLVHGLRRLRRAQEDPRAKDMRLIDFLDLVAMGTIADLVPLRFENRIYTRYGLEMLRRRQRAGLAALLDSCGIEPAQPLLPTDVSFRLGPRINASGRLDDATIAVELLLCPNPANCRAMANQLNEFNRERQEKERQVTEQAKQMIEANGFDKDPALVLYGEDWHPGVVGIVAGKLARHYGRPCIVLGRESPGIAKGSGRSIHSINLVDVLSRCKERLINWGGHPMAVGVSLACEGVDDFRKELIHLIQCTEHCPECCEPPLEIAAWVDVSQVGEDLLNDIECMAPFGEGNPEPIFGVRNVTLPYPPEIFGEVNYRFFLPATPPRRGLSVVAWRKANHRPPANEPIELALRLSWNYYNGRQYPQAELLDWRPAQQTNRE